MHAAAATTTSTAGRQTVKTRPFSRSFMNAVSKRSPPTTSPANRYLPSPRSRPGPAATSAVIVVHAARDLRPRTPFRNDDDVRPQESHTCVRRDNNIISRMFYTAIGLSLAYLRHVKLLSSYDIRT